MKNKETPSSKENVLLVHNFYQIGGGEHTVFENEKALLTQHGHKVTTYTRDNTELNRSLLKKALMPLTTVFSLRSYIEVKKIIRREDIDIVHCHNTFPLISPSVYYAAWRSKVPVVQTIHNFRFLCPCGVFFRDGHVCEDCTSRGFSCALRNKCYRDSVIQTLVVTNMLLFHRAFGTYKKLNYIFLTEFNKQKFKQLLKNGTGKQFIKSNFEDIPAAGSSDADRSGYVFIGRLDRYKGIRFILDIWKQEDKKDLYIFGDGEYKDDVLAAEKEQPNIHYLGFKPKDEVLEYLRNAEALIFASKGYEGFPMTLIEAFACGTPVICSDIGNQADIVRSNNAGALYELNNEESFTEAKEAVSERFNEFSSNALNAYNNLYCAEANYQQLKEIYETLLRQ